MQTKATLHSQLVELGKQYNPMVWPFPDVRHATRETLATRLTWMRRALELKPSDRDLAYNLFSAAWNGYLDPSVAQKAGLQ